MANAGEPGSAKLFATGRTLKLGEVSISSSDIKDVLDEALKLGFYPVTVEAKGKATACVQARAVRKHIHNFDIEIFTL